VRRSRSTLSHNSPRSSSRRIPVSMASATKCASQLLRAPRQAAKQPFFLIALEAPVPRASLRRAAHEGAGIGGQVDVPLAPGRVDRVREDAEFAVDRGAGDDFKPFVGDRPQAGSS